MKPTADVLDEISRLTHEQVEKQYRILERTICYLHWPSEKGIRVPAPKSQLD